MDLTFQGVMCYFTSQSFIVTGSFHGLFCYATDSHKNINSHCPFSLANTESDLNPNIVMIKEDTTGLKTHEGNILIVTNI